MQKLSGAGEFERAEPNHFAEQLRTESLSVGTYSIPAGGVDDQAPHHEDEIYVVTTGRATIVTPSGTEQVGPGDVLFVPAEEEHRFTDITEDLALLVFFARRIRPLTRRLADVRTRHPRVSGRRLRGERSAPEVVAGGDRLASTAFTGLQAGAAAATSSYSGCTLTTCRRTARS